MTQYIVIIPKIGEPYITNYENRLHIDNSFYGLFNCKHLPNNKLVAHIDYTHYKTYQYPDNKSCDIQLYLTNEYYRTKIYGYSKEEADDILNTLNYTLGK